MAPLWARRLWVSIAAAKAFTLKVVAAPTDWIMWNLDSALLLLCLLGGPLSLHAAVMLFCVVGVLTRLIG